MTVCFVRDFIKVPILSKTFAAWVIEKRLASGISQRRLASIAGVTPPMISKIESGGSAGSPEMVNKLADALGASRSEAMSAWVSGETGEPLTYVTNPLTATAVKLLEGLSPEMQAASVEYLKGAKTAADILRERREAQTMGKRADRAENPSINESPAAETHGEDE